jgi:hypothetical protein
MGIRGVKIKDRDRGLGRLEISSNNKLEIMRRHPT